MALKFQNFLGSTSPDTPPPLEKRDMHGPLLIQSVTLFKPAGYFNLFLLKPLKMTLLTTVTGMNKMTGMPLLTGMTEMIFRDY